MRWWLKKYIHFLNNIQQCELLKHFKETHVVCLGIVIWLFSLNEIAQHWYVSFQISRKDWGWVHCQQKMLNSGFWWTSCWNRKTKFITGAYCSCPSCVKCQRYKSNFAYNQTLTQSKKRRLKGFNLENEVDIYAAAVIHSIACLQIPVMVFSGP